MKCFLLIFFPAEPCMSVCNDITYQSLFVEHEEMFSVLTQEEVLCVDLGPTVQFKYFTLYITKTQVILQCSHGTV